MKANNRHIYFNPMEQINLLTYSNVSEKQADNFIGLNYQQCYKQYINYKINEKKTYAHNPQVLKG